MFWHNGQTTTIRINESHIQRQARRIFQTDPRTDFSTNGVISQVRSHARRNRLQHNSLTQKHGACAVQLTRTLAINRSYDHKANACLHQNQSPELHCCPRVTQFDFSVPSHTPRRCSSVHHQRECKIGQARNASIVFYSKNQKNSQRLMTANDASLLRLQPSSGCSPQPERRRKETSRCDPELIGAMALM